MNRFNWNKLLRPATYALLAGAALIPSEALAVASYPGLLTYTQPDGTELKVMKVGDENGHYLLTEDGILLMQADKGLTYAALNADGQVVASTVYASAPALRSDSEKRFLASFDSKQLIDTRVAELKVGNKRVAAAARKAGANTLYAAEAYDKGPGLFPSATFPTAGSPDVLVVLVEFSNKSFAQENPKDYFTRMLNEEGFNEYEATGSALDFHKHNSGGIFTPNFHVYGPAKLNKPYGYYGANDKMGNENNIGDFVIDACKALDDEIDYSKYDTDGDGYVDNVFFFYAGEGEATSIDPSTIWPHQYNLTELTNEALILDGKQIDHYACTCEVDGINKRTDGIGTFLHEFSHVMGLPDLYDTNNIHSQTPGSWDIMDRGSYNNEGRTPPNYSGFERYALGWIKPTPFTVTEHVELQPLDTSNTCFIANAENSIGQYFIFENRQQIGQDKYIPSHGMLVWHVYFIGSVWENNIVNNMQKRMYVDLEEACSDMPVSFRDYNPFPGAGDVTQFTPNTTPAFKDWDGRSLGFKVTEIAESEDGIISFLVTNTNSGVEDTFADQEVVSVNYYDLSGRAVTNPDKGIYLKTSHRADGTKTTEKIIVK